MVQVIDELKALESNRTWHVVTLPAGHHVTGSKWVYKVKFKADEFILQVAQVIVWFVASFMTVVC